uniref:Hermansky-Pudlak syndrome 5 protein homolog n=1 Tax=Cacopsylla melanoneura TaxID=428564 RepID=A0A8D9E1H2_9HEMI
MCNEASGKVPSLLVDYGSQSEILSTLKSTTRIKYTCFNVSEKYIIFGATSGSLYLFNREPCSFVQIIPNQEGAVTNVTISPNEQLIAFSSFKGIVCVVEKASKTSPTSMLIKSFEHSSSDVTDFVWTSSSSQLFVGDSLGRISVINTSLFLGKTVFQVPCFTLMQLDSRIIQMSTCVDWLLVSTMTRSYLCDTVHEQYRQIGKKLRDGHYGACFVQNKIYSARPGARLWEVNTEGRVLSTQQYKNSLNVPPTPLVKLNQTNLSPATATDTGDKGFNFNKLGIINDKYIFTFTKDALYVFDPERLDLVLWNNDVHDIVDVKCYQDTLYVWSSHNKVNVFTLSPLDKCLLRLYFNENYLTCAKLTIHFANHLLNSPHLLHSLHHLSDLGSKLKRYDNIDSLNENLQPILNELAKYSKDNRVVKLNSGIYVVNNGISEHSNINKNARSSSVPRDTKARNKTVSVSSTSLPDLDYADLADSDDEDSKFLTITSPDIIHDALVELGNNVTDSIRHILDVRKPNKMNIMEPFDVGKPDFLLGLNQNQAKPEESQDIVKKNRRNKNKPVDTSELVTICDKYTLEVKKLTPNEYIKAELETKLLHILVKLNTNLKQNTRLSAQYIYTISAMIKCTLGNHVKLKAWLLSNEMTLLGFQSPDNLLHSPVNLAQKRLSMIETTSDNQSNSRPRNHSMPASISSKQHTVDMFTFDNHMGDTGNVFTEEGLPHSTSLAHSEFKSLLEDVYNYEDIYLDILMSKLLDKLSVVLNISSVISLPMLVNLSPCYYYSLSTVLNLQEHIHAGLNVGISNIDTTNILVNLNMILILLQLGHIITSVEMFIKCGPDLNLRLISYVIIKLYTRYIENGLDEQEAYSKCNHLFLTFLNHVYVRDLHLNFEDDNHVMMHTLKCFLAVNQGPSTPSTPTQTEQVYTCRCGFPLADKLFPSVHYLNIGKLLLVTCWDRHRRQFNDSSQSETSSSTTVTVLPKTCHQCGKLPKHELDTTVQAKFKIFDDFAHHLSRNQEHIESYELLMNICRLVPAMWKHILCLIRNSNYFVCSLFLSIHLGLVSELPFCVEDVHDSQMLEVILLLNIKVKKGFCLNCGKQDGARGGALDWTALSVFILKCLGATETLALLQKYAQFIPSTEIDRRFYQACALSSMAESRCPQSDSLPYSVICNVTRGFNDDDYNQDASSLLGTHNLSKLQTALRSDLANVSSNGHLSDVASRLIFSTPVQTEATISHWGARIDLSHSSQTNSTPLCLFCSLPLKSEALLSGKHNGLLLYPCSHLFHTMCVRHSSRFLVCPLCSSTSQSSASSSDSSSITMS